MTIINPLVSDNVQLESKGVINVTRTTVRFSRTVYQTRNISEFSEGQVRMGLIPWNSLAIILIAGLVIGFSGFSIYQLNQDSTLSLVVLVGAVLVMAGVAGFIWNLIDPQYYGLLITLNSGDKRLFVTQDIAGLRQVISTIYEFIETEKDTIYQISISNSQVRGNFIQGNAKDVLFGSND